MNTKKHVVRWIVFFLLAMLIILLIFTGVNLMRSSMPYYNARRLIDAIENNDVVRVQKMLEDGVDPNQTNIKPSKLWRLVETSADRPLTVACGEGNLEIVKLLIDYGATAEGIEYTGRSPLRETLLRYQQDDVEIVKLLLQSGADPYSVESDITAVFAAADMIPMPVGSENYSIDYDATAAEDITQMVEMLLTKNSVDIQTVHGKTLLMYAAKRGNICLAERLIAMGCDVIIVDNQGKTAMDYAVEANKQDMVLLLEYYTGQ